MTKFWLVIKHDFMHVVRQRSFWLLSFLFPLLMFAVQGYFLLEESREAEASAEEPAESSPAELLRTIGLVDPAELIEQIPADMPQDLFTRFEDVEAAGSALEAGLISQYVLVPEDFLAEGVITIFDEDFAVQREGNQEEIAFSNNNDWVLGFILNTNLIDDGTVALAYGNPTPGQWATYHQLAGSEEAEDETAGAQSMAQFASSLIPYLYYFLLLISASYVLRSVVYEKENRMAEMMVARMSPRRLMLAKILAVSLVVAVEVAIWVVMGVVAYSMRGANFDFSLLNFSPSFAFFAILFLMLGYLQFSAILAAVGSMSRSATEAGGMTMLLVIPLMPVMMFGRLFVEEPEHPLVIILSLFPLSSPAAMVNHLALSDVPFWQIGVSIVLLLASSYLFISIAARFFQSGTMLSGAPFSLGRFFSTMKGSLKRSA